MGEKIIQIFPMPRKMSFSCIKNRAFVAKCTDFKSQCYPIVKICPEIINFLFFCPEKVKYYPEKKSAEIFEKFTQKIKICPVTESSEDEDDEFSKCTLLPFVLSR